MTLKVVLLLAGGATGAILDFLAGRARARYRHRQRRRHERGDPWTAERLDREISELRHELGED